MFGVAFADGPAVRVAFLGRWGHALLFWVAQVAMAVNGLAVLAVLLKR